MRLEIRKPIPPPLWEWIKSRLPETLRASTKQAGYGETYGIEIKQGGLLCFGGIPIAEVGHDVIKLYYPEWTSDFQDLLTKYERETEVDTTLIIFGSDKELGEG